MKDATSPSAVENYVTIAAGLAAGKVISSMPKPSFGPSVATEAKGVQAVTKAATGETAASGGLLLKRQHHLVRVVSKLKLGCKMLKI